MAYLPIVARLATSTISFVDPLADYLAQRDNERRNARGCIAFHWRKLQMLKYVMAVLVASALVLPLAAIQVSEPAAAATKAKKPKAAKSAKAPTKKCGEFMYFSKGKCMDARLKS
jgi:hypothetical protein